MFRKKIDPDAPRYGSFNNRVIASALDIGLVLLVAVPVANWILYHVFPPMDAEPVLAFLQSPDFRYDYPSILKLAELMNGQHVFGRVAVSNGLQLLAIGGYLLPFWFRYSSSPGKMLFRMKIVDEKSGLPMTRFQAVVRFLGYLVSTLPLSLGFVWVVLNRRRRGFHDIIAGTMVIVKPRKKRVPKPDADAVSGPLPEPLPASEPSPPDASSTRQSADP